MYINVLSEKHITNINFIPLHIGLIWHGFNSSNINRHIKLMSFCQWNVFDALWTIGYWYMYSSPFLKSTGIVSVYEHVLHSDLPNKYFGMRHWKQEFGILGKSENINRITVTNEILEAAFIVIYQLNQAFWNQTHKSSIIFIHSYNFNIFTFITMFIIHHYSKTYPTRKHTCTSKVSLFFSDPEAI